METTKTKEVEEGKYRNDKESEITQEDIEEFKTNWDESVTKFD
jgi:hypothetical protein